MALWSGSVNCHTLEAVTMVILVLSSSNTEREAERERAGLLQDVPYITPITAF